jgi:hypothetical protein
MLLSATQTTLFLQVLSNSRDFSFIQPFEGANTVARGGRVPPEVGNGVISAYRASLLPLKGTKLVVLSACASGLPNIFLISY